MDKHIEKILKMSPQEVYRDYLWRHKSTKEKIYYCFNKFERTFYKVFRCLIPFVIVLIVLSTFTLVDSGLNDEYYLRKAVDDIQIILPIYEREYEKISKLGGALMKEKSSNFDEDKAFVYALLIIKYSKLYKVDPHLIAAIMAKESEFNPNAVSKAKAKGLMQIHQPAYKLPDKVLFDPEQNIKIGIRILLMHKNINPKGFLKDYGGFESQEKRLTEGVKYEKDVRNKRERIRRITSRGGV